MKQHLSHKDALALIGALERKIHFLNPEKFTWTGPHGSYVSIPVGKCEVGLFRGEGIVEVNSAGVWLQSSEHSTKLDDSVSSLVDKIEKLKPASKVVADIITHLESL